MLHMGALDDKALVDITQVKCHWDFCTALVALSLTLCNMWLLKNRHDLFEKCFPIRSDCCMMMQQHSETLAHFSMTRVIEHIESIEKTRVPFKPSTVTWVCFCAMVRNLRKGIRKQFATLLTPRFIHTLRFLLSIHSATRSTLAVIGLQGWLKQKSRK